MNFFTKVLRAIRHGGGPSWFGMATGKRRFNYAREVGSLIDASVVMAPVQWVQRALPEARLTVRKAGRQGEMEDILHAMLDLIATPNPFYGDIMLWWMTVLSLLTGGDAYWLIVRNGVNRPAELWAVPHWTMEPHWPADGSVFIDHYVYTPGGGGGQMIIAPEDVVHFRHGINPNNPRKGLAPLASAIREIFMDNESSAFVSALLRNMGVPGVVISPKGGSTPAPQDVAATKAWFTQEFGGDNRGKPIVMGGPTDVQPYGFNPQQMNMGEARDIAEERVCALLGIPAAVVGFGAGLQSTKVGATMEEMRKLAWHNGVLPIARLIADELQRSLLPLFGKIAPGTRVEWDVSQVAACQEDEDKRVERWGKKLASGGITVAEYRVGIGEDVDPSHDIYLRPISMIEVPKGEMRPAPVVDPEPKPKEVKSRSDVRARPEAYKRGAAFVAILQRQERGHQAAFGKAIKKLALDLGAETGAAALAVFEGKAQKDETADAGIVAAILEKLGIAAWQGQLKSIYEAQYLEVGKAVSEAAERAGLGASLPDPVARSIIAAGGRRSGLVDLDTQTRATVFDALAEGRAEGEGPEALARRIAQHVEGGPWQSAEMRAQIIARTETKYAQNISTIERGMAGGVQSFIVFDGRFGPGRSKPDHIERDGSIVTAPEAEAMAAAEHPNGTLSFAPHFEE